VRSQGEVLTLEYSSWARYIPDIV